MTSDEIIEAVAEAIFNKLNAPIRWDEPHPEDMRPWWREVATEALRAYEETTVGEPVAYGCPRCGGVARPTVPKETSPWAHVPCATCGCLGPAHTVDRKGRTLGCAAHGDCTAFELGMAP